MSNLKNFNNIYANIAESAYLRRPKSFQKKGDDDTEGKIIDYSKDVATEGDLLATTTIGGVNLPNGGIVHLQSDAPVARPEKIFGQKVIDNSKSSMTDKRAGFSAYMLTDTKYMNTNTRNVYLAIRGSDNGSDPKNLNDWLANDANFAVTSSFIPQSALAYNAAKQTLKKMAANAPNSVLNITGHSLGTMVSAQAVAKLYYDDPQSFNRLGHVVLFDGPDVTQSLRKMGLSKEEIRAIGKKVTYYVNPLDIVSMLNRTDPIDEQFGRVHYIVPLNFKDTFSSNGAHDFGEFQIDDGGHPLTASKSFHPEMLVAGKELAHLIRKTMGQLKAIIPAVTVSDLLLLALDGLMAVPVIASASRQEVNGLLAEFKRKYSVILKKARRESISWDMEHVGDFQARIAGATGGKKIILRQELLQMVAQIAITKGEDRMAEVQHDIQTARQKMTDSVKSARQAATNMGPSLSTSELNAVIGNFRLSTFWDEARATATIREAQKYQKELAQFAQTLIRAGQSIEGADREGAKGFDRLMQATISAWGKLQY